jgi:hypothetical protein
MTLIPYVIEQTGRGERSYDIYSRLLKDRIIILSDEVNDTTASFLLLTKAFIIDDLPTFDLPAKAISGRPVSGYWSFFTAEIKNSAFFIIIPLPFSSLVIMKTC